MIDDAALVRGLAEIVGESRVLTAEADKAPHLREWRDLFRGEARAVVKPGSTAELAACVRFCVAHRVPMVPQGGNTGLVGGQIPMAGTGAVIISTTRLAAIREVDPVSDTMTVEAGVTLAAAQAAAEARGRLFPLSLASEGSCTIGGNIATNAGGTAVLAYGNTRDLVLGVEAVLPDGEVWNGLSRLRKDNTGFDLRGLLVGSEGTLGIVTAAVLKLFPLPAARATAFCGVPSPEAALALLARFRAGSGGTLTTFELMPRFGIDVVLRHAPGTRDPLGEPHPWYILAEVSGSDDAALEAAVSALLEAALEAGECEDAAIAGSLEQRSDFWRLREAMSEVQRLEGGSIKHDVSVPVASVPRFIAAASAAVTEQVPGCRPLPFGHLGDGNIHFNVSQPVGMDKDAFLALWDEMNAVVHGIVASMDGSISAEHGIGRLKRHLMHEVKDPAALGAMRAIKAALDPHGLMNPGAVL